VIFRDDYPDNQNLISNADGTATLDTGKANRGLILVKVSSSFASDPTIRIKVIVSKSGATPSDTYQYTLLRRGAYEGIPLQMGSGTYTVSVYKRTDPATSNYSSLLPTQTFSVSLDSGLAPFLVSHQFSDFSYSSACVAKANQLCSGLTAALDKVDAVYRYIIANISYDSQLASDINAGLVVIYVPDPDRTLSKKKGICFDYSALLSSMLRSQGIPVRLVMGLAPNGVYHAWNEVYFEGKGWVKVNGFSWVYINGSGWQLFDATFGHSISNQQIYDNIIGERYTKQKYY
jgi:transglutaminase-like putative cysteine protease